MSCFGKAAELGELLGGVSAQRHCIGFTFIENDDNSTRHQGLTLRGRTPAYSFAAATVPLFFFFLLMLFGIFIFPRNDSLLLIREIFRSDALSAGLAHVCDWSDACALVPFHVHVQALYLENFGFASADLRRVRCRLRPMTAEISSANRV